MPQNSANFASRAEFRLSSHPLLYCMTKSSTKPIVAQEVCEELKLPIAISSYFFYLFMFGKSVNVVL